MRLVEIGNFEQLVGLFVLIKRAGNLGGGHFIVLAISIVHKILSLSHSNVYAHNLNDFQLANVY